MDVAILRFLLCFPLWGWLLNSNVWVGKGNLRLFAFEVEDPSACQIGLRVALNLLLVVILLSEKATL